MKQKDLKPGTKFLDDEGDLHIVLGPENNMFFVTALYYAHEWILNRVQLNPEKNCDFLVLHDL